MVRVDEARAAYVHAGDRVIVVIDAAAEQGADDTGLEGVVTEVARAVGADQRAFTVKVSLPSTVTVSQAASPASSLGARLAVRCLQPRDSAARPGVIGLCGAEQRGDAASRSRGRHRQKAWRWWPALTPVNRLSSHH